MKLPAVDASLMPPDAEPVADRFATEYLEAELDKVAPPDVGPLSHAVLYVAMLHGELGLRDMQIICEVAAYLRVKGALL